MQYNVTISTTQYSATQGNVIQYSATISTTQYSATQGNTMQYSTMQQLI